MSKKLLILGGNGFIGAEVIEYLSEHNQNYEFILLNRGHWNDWDLATRIKPKILESIIFDRKTDSLKECLKGYLVDTHIIFEALIDFSGYKSKDIKSVIKELSPDKIKRYIYISSDSIYEVCEEKFSDKGRDVISSEYDAKRPESKSRREFLKEFDSYGHHKLKYKYDEFNN